MLGALPTWGTLTTPGRWGTLQEAWSPCAPRDSDQDRRDHQAGARLTRVDRELPAHICVCSDMSAQTHHSTIKVLGKTPGSFGTTAEDWGKKPLESQRASLSSRVCRVKIINWLLQK